MALTKICRLWLLSICLLIASPLYAQFVTIKHLLEIHTRLSYVEGEPTWLIEIRDMKSGRVLPYIFDFKEYDNSWIAFSGDRAYRVIASNLKFGPGMTITNFCGIEDGIIEGKSLSITLTGALTPYPPTSRCIVRKFNDAGLTVVDIDD